MNVPLRFLFFVFLLRAATAAFEMDYDKDVDENTRQFIEEQNRSIRKLIKEEAQNLLSTISKSFDKKLASSDLKAETSLQNLSASFNEHLLRIESNVSEQIRTNHQQIARSILYLTSLIPPPNLTEVEEVHVEHGTIYFTGGTNSNLRRKIWVLKSVAGDSCRRMNFVMETMSLGDNARLSLWGSYEGGQHEWKGSPVDWQKIQEGFGSVILVTLTIPPGAVETPTFKLKFTTTGNDTAYRQTSEVLSKEGPQVVSFPSNNTIQIPPFSMFTAVVAPPSGRTFGTTLKFLNFSGTQPNCDNGHFYVWFLDETGTGTHYKRLPSSVARKCGSPGTISESLGNSTVTIFKLTSLYHANNGTVFRVEFY